MIDKIYSRRWLIQRLHGGPFGNHVDRWAAMFLEQGYRQDPLLHKMSLVAALGRWLEGKHHRLAELDDEKVDAFVHARQRRSRIQGEARMTLRFLLDDLRSRGDILPPLPKAAPTAFEQALHEYSHY